MQLVDLKNILYLNYIDELETVEHKIAKDVLVLMNNICEEPVVDESDLEKVLNFSKNNLTHINVEQFIEKMTDRGIRLPAII